MRTCILTVAEQKDFDPITFTKKLKAAGFKLLNDTCPIKIAPKWDTIAGDHGEIIWRQWDPN